MADNLVSNILAVTLFLVSVFISIRAFHAYGKVQSPRLFILGLSMGVIALTAAADFTASNFPSLALNTDWFLFIGQAVSFLFILLSLMSSADEYLSRLMRLHAFASLLTLALLFLSPTLPAISDPLLSTVLGGSRSVICLIICFFYISTFLGKQTRFSLLMSLAFLLLAFGYLLIVQKFFVTNPNQTLFDNAGDIIRLGGLVSLLAAVLFG